MPFRLCDLRMVGHNPLYCNVLTSALTICGVLTSGLNAADIDYDILICVYQEITRAQTDYCLKSDTSIH